MTTELIPIGNTAAKSAEFSLVAGDSTTLTLRAASVVVPAGALGTLEKKNSDDTWTNIASWSVTNPSMVLVAIGTFRVSRNASAVSFGIDRD